MGETTHQPGDVDAVRYDPATETYHHRHDWTGPNHLSYTIVKTLSVANGHDLTEMMPLYSVLDPEALETLLSTTSDGTVDVSFIIEGCVVTVTDRGHVVVDPRA